MGKRRFSRAESAEISERIAAMWDKGMTPTQIGKELDINPGSVSSRLKRTGRITRPMGTCDDCKGECGPRTFLCPPCKAARHRARTVQPCRNCGGPKEPGRRWLCNDCRNQKADATRRDQIARMKNERTKVVKAAMHEAGIKRPADRDTPDGTRWCAFCVDFVKLANFPLRNGKPAAYCAPCQSEYNHERNLKIKFGLTLVEYRKMLDQQEGRCAICARKPRQRRLAVDHDHVTGQVRGLLCTRCNHDLLGKANESPAMLRRAANYLERPPWVTGKPMSDLDQWSEAQVEAAVEELSRRSRLVHLDDGDALVAMPMKELMAILPEDVLLTLGIVEIQDDSGMVFQSSQDER